MTKGSKTTTMRGVANTGASVVSGADNGVGMVSMADDDPYHVYMLRHPADRASCVVPQLPKQPEMADTRLRYRRIGPSRSGSIGSFGAHFPPRFQFPARSSLLESLTSDDEPSSFAVRRRRPTSRRRNRRAKKAVTAALSSQKLSHVVQPHSPSLFIRLRPVSSKTDSSFDFEDDDDDDDDDDDEEDDVVDDDNCHDGHVDNVDADERRKPNPFYGKHASSASSSSSSSSSLETLEAEETVSRASSSTPLSTSPATPRPSSPTLPLLRHAVHESSGVDEIKLISTLRNSRHDDNNKVIVNKGAHNFLQSQVINNNLDNEDQLNNHCDNYNNNNECDVGMCSVSKAGGGEKDGCKAINEFNNIDIYKLSSGEKDGYPKELRFTTEGKFEDGCSPKSVLSGVADDISNSRRQGDIDSVVGEDLSLKQTHLPVKDRQRMVIVDVEDVRGGSVTASNACDSRKCESEHDGVGDADDDCRISNDDLAQCMRREKDMSVSLIHRPMNADRDSRRLMAIRKLMRMLTFARAPFSRVNARRKSHVR